MQQSTAHRNVIDDTDVEITWSNEPDWSAIDPDRVRFAGAFGLMRHKIYMTGVKYIEKDGYAYWPKGQLVANLMGSDKNNPALWNHEAFTNNPAVLFDWFKANKSMVGAAYVLGYSKRGDGLNDLRGRQYIAVDMDGKANSISAPNNAANAFLDPKFRVFTRDGDLRVKTPLINTLNPGGHLLFALPEELELIEEGPFKNAKDSYLEHIEVWSKRFMVGPGTRAYEDTQPPAAVARPFIRREYEFDKRCIIGYGSAEGWPFIKVPDPIELPGPMIDALKEKFAKIGRRQRRAAEPYNIAEDAAKPEDFAEMHDGRLVQVHNRDDFVYSYAVHAYIKRTPIASIREDLVRFFDLDGMYKQSETTPAQRTVARERYCRLGGLIDQKIDQVERKYRDKISAIDAKRTGGRIDEVWAAIEFLKYMEARGLPVRIVMETKSIIMYNGKHWTNQNPSEFSFLTGYYDEFIKTEMDACDRELYPRDADETGAAAPQVSKDRAAELISRKNKLAKLRPQAQAAQVFKNFANHSTQHTDQFTVSSLEMSRQTEHVFPCDSGYIDLKTKTLVPFEEGAKFYVFGISKAKYDPANKPQTPFFDNLIATWWTKETLNCTDAALDEYKAYMKRAMGYCITGSKSANAFFVLKGIPGSGKSTWVNIIRAILGNHLSGGILGPALSADATVHQTFQALEVARKARAVFCGEWEEDYALKSGIVKQLTGNDIMQARRSAGEEPMQFVNSSKLVFTTNHKRMNFGRNSDSADDSVTSRARVLPFSRPIRGNEGLVIPDFELEEKVREELDGILWYAVEGAYEFYQDPNCLRLNKSSVVSGDTQELIKASNWRNQLLNNIEFDKDPDSTWMLTKEALGALSMRMMAINGEDKFQPIRFPHQYTFANLLKDKFPENRNTWTKTPRDRQGNVFYFIKGARLAVDQVEALLDGGIRATLDKFGEKRAMCQYDLTFDENLKQQIVPPGVDKVDETLKGVNEI